MVCSLSQGILAQGHSLIAAQVDVTLTLHDMTRILQRPRRGLVGTLRCPLNGAVMGKLPDRLVSSQITLET